MNVKSDSQREQSGDAGNISESPARANREIPGVTIREFAESMGVAYQTVQRWINPGGMPVLGWLEMGGRRFVRLDEACCREWALANRPALSGVGPGGWRPGSGRPKAARPRTKKAGTTARAIRATTASAAHFKGLAGVFVPNDGGDAHTSADQRISSYSSRAAPLSHNGGAASVATTAASAPPTSAYLEARTAALIADAKMKELKYRRLAGEVVPAADVEAAWGGVLRSFATQLETIAPAAARAIGDELALDDESLTLVERAVEEEVRRVRAALVHAVESEASRASGDVCARSTTGHAG